MQLYPSPEGFRFQLRIGAGRRPSFTVKTQDPAVAQQRAAEMTELARLLVSRGKRAQAMESLDTLANAQSDEEFAEVAGLIRELCAEATPAPQGKRTVTFGELANQWLTGKLAERYPDHVQIKRPRSLAADASRIKHLCKTIGDVPLEAFTLDHAEKAMRGLPKTCVARDSRRAYAAVIRRVLELAVFPCRILKQTPLPKGFTPKPGKPPQFQCLYPSEDAQLCACQDVEFGWRLLFGCAVRLGLRLESLVDLTWRNLDLDNGFLRTRTKTIPVEFDLDPGTLRALRMLRALRGDEPETARIFPQLEITGWAERLRASLITAGITRPALHEDADDSLKLRFHDLRASFITVALANGKPEAWVTERSGHTSSQVLYRYVRPHFKKLAQRDWLPLDVALGLVPTPAPHGLPEPSDPASVVSPALAEPTHHVPTDKAEHAGAHDRPDVGHSPTSPGAQARDARDLACEPGALPLTGAELAAESSDELPPAAGAGEAEQLLEGGVGQGAVGQGDGGFMHGGPLSDGAEKRLPGVASGLASETRSSVVALSDSPFVSVPWQGVPEVNRTPDQCFRNPTAQHPSLHERDTSDASRTSRHPSVHELPVARKFPALVLSEVALTELLQLATEAQRWHLVAQLGAQLQAARDHATSRAEEARRTVP